MATFMKAHKFIFELDLPEIYNPVETLSWKPGFNCTFNTFI